MLRIQDNDGWSVNIGKVGKVQFMIDTGAAGSVMSLDSLSAITGVPTTALSTSLEEKRKVTFRGVTGGTLQAACCQLNDCTIDNKRIACLWCSVVTKGVISRDILGRDFIRSWRVKGFDWPAPGYSELAYARTTSGNVLCLDYFDSDIIKKQVLTRFKITDDDTLAYLNCDGLFKSNWDTYADKLGIPADLRQKERDRLFVSLGAYDNDSFENLIASNFLQR